MARLTNLFRLFLMFCQEFEEMGILVLDVGLLVAHLAFL
jgi:hypothetical protein